MAELKLDYGIKNCAKCENNIRCEECVYNKKSIESIINQTAKEFLQELDNRLWDDIDTDSDIGGAAHNQTIRSLMKWVQRKYGVEVKE